GRLGTGGRDPRGGAEGGRGGRGVALRRSRSGDSDGPLRFLETRVRLLGHGRGGGRAAGGAGLAGRAGESRAGAADLEGEVAGEEGQAGVSGNEGRHDSGRVLRGAHMRRVTM